MKYLQLVLSILLLGMPGGNVIARSLGQQVAELGRVVGEPRSRAEGEAWQAVAEAKDVGKRVRLAQKFLADYPRSGLTAYAHRVLANAAHEKGDIENFVQHGEQVLRELPETPELLALLANIYSERGDVVKATDYASRALPLLDQAGEKPGAMPSVQWVALRQGLRAAAHYALGRCHLELWTKSKSSLKPPEKLRQAVENLNRTLEMDPQHGYAAFRLGFAQSRSQDAEAALAAYARACIIEGPAAGPARKNLERIHKDLKRDTASKWSKMSVDEILKEERERLEAQMAEREQKLNRLAAQVDSRELMKTAVPPSN